jgi:hypothetical protein
VGEETQFVERALAGTGIGSAETRHVPRGFDHAEVVVKGQLLRHVTEQTANALALLADIETSNANRPLEIKQTQHAANQRRLACAVGTPQRHRLPGANLKAHAIQHGRATVSFMNFFKLDHHRAHKFT